MSFKIFIYILVQVIGIALVPLFDTIIKNTKAILQGRKGPPLLQTYYDLYKLFFKKDDLYISLFTSKLTSILPIVIISISVFVFMCVPMVFGYFDINIITLFYIVGLGSFFTMLYAMDNATYFGGLGVSREMFLIVLIEPVMIMLIGILGLFFKTIHIGDIHTKILSMQYPLFIGIVLILLGIVFWYVILGETKRFPFDNPATHLELTMIHEAMLLETSGLHLGIMELASKINLIAFLNLFIYIFIPFNFGISNGFLLFILWLIKLMILVGLVGFWEIFIVKIRIFKYQNVYLFLLMLQLFVFIIYILKI